MHSGAPRHERPPSYSSQYPRGPLPTHHAGQPTHAPSAYHPNMPPSRHHNLSRYSSTGSSNIRIDPSTSHSAYIQAMFNNDPNLRQYVRQAQSSSSAARSETPPIPRQVVDERDLCPVCHKLLPPKGAYGDETGRDNHVIQCIEIASHEPASRAISSARRESMAYQPSARPITSMLIFAATEKDCVGEDGSPQECTICFVEYDVGDQLARLECLCKFHRECIKGWFERKRMCPVHKVDTEES